ncbi:hypothetical protein [Bizionia sp. APA-3]|uniref:hypothetical protein n=1 Tax=Bizionia sp. APA-3 TaxID=1861784 RepID=UPI0018D29BFA|nr:hypothetical protein [Bizionia sp. APA-3]
MRKRLWRSKPYAIYLQCYGAFLNCFIRINKKRTSIIFINGMRRSGNHYLMKTIMDSSYATVIFYNNQKACSNLDVRDGLQTKYRFSKNILIIVGYEDLLIQDYNESCEFITQTRLKNVDYLKLVVVRDLRNVMASRLNHSHMAKHLKSDHKVLNQTKLLWKDHHDYYDVIDYHVIRYNFLLRDLSAIDLKLFYIQTIKESKKVLNRYGGGSSFDNEHFHSRYMKFKDDKTYLTLIQGLEFQDEKIYGIW